jgi:beta-lactamase regulating signal transducer with metallopeptidase domain
MLQPSNLHHIVSASFESPLGVLFIWTCQAFVVLGMAWVAVKLDWSHTAAIRCRIWLIAMAASAALPALSFFFRTLPAPAMAVVPRVTNVSGQISALPGPIASPHISLWVVLIWLVLPALWIAGVIASLLRLTSSLRRLHKIRLAAEHLSAEDLCSGWDGPTAKRLDRTPIALSREVRSPGLAGLLRPTILLPADITSWATPEERAAMLRHEMAHIERHDHLLGLLVSIVRAFLFFHPMVHLACNQIGLERELACDDRVLGLGARPDAYAESILKAVERSILADAVHQAPSFASKKTLERRLEMILNNARSAQPIKQWRFLLLPIALLIGITWLVMPQGAGMRKADASGPDSRIAGRISTLDVSGAASHETPNSALGPRQTASDVVDKQTIWIDRVQRGPLSFQIRGPGALTSAGTGLYAQVSLTETMTKDVRAGQQVSLADAGGGSARGKVTSVNRPSQDGLVTIDIAVEGDSVVRMRPGITVDAFIQIGRLDDVLYVGRPAISKQDSTGSLFKVDSDGKGATRVQVRFGRSSVNKIAILEGLSEGDQVILSDTSALEGVDRIIIK